mgnify:CR=1 FL=1
MFVNFQKLPEESRIWIYGAQDVISSENQKLISDKIIDFLNNWSHHGKPLTSSFTFIKNRFLVIGLDESKNPTGGCSMDTLQNLILDIDLNKYKYNILIPTSSTNQVRINFSTNISISGNCCVIVVGL